ncbi:hypothetical protein BKA64DRAFT_202232 [Cadophora sp. MPI-SDFR-AT-0126]|nr:hypothetical protein BKA64DRAFT_202232 [Leotiomycetes sp. MPI-SDFR-AT-0126]
MYVLWFQKPYDIQYPILVRTDEFPEALAFIVASSRWVGYSGFKSTRQKTWPDRLRIDGAQDKDPKFYWFKGSDDPTVNLSGSTVSSDADLKIQDYRYRVQRSFPGKIRGKENTGFDYFPIADIATCLSLSSWQALSSGLGPSTEQLCRISLSTKDILRLNLAGRFISNLITFLDQKDDLSPMATFADPRDKANCTQRLKFPVSRPFGPGTFRPFGESLIRPRSENTIAIGDSLDQMSLRAVLAHWLAVFLIPSAYGGMHLAARHSIFPSYVESTLWAASCYILLGVGVVLTLLLSWPFLAVLSELCIPPRVWDAFVLILASGALLIVVPLYVSARVFLVVESFVSLRHVPSEVYQTPERSITNYIPHL